MTLLSRHLTTLFLTLHPVSGGHFRGERLNGEVSSLIGSDRLLGRADGTFQQDVRLLLAADGGDLILMTYRGVKRSSLAVDKRLADGEAVDPSEYYLRTTPYFETAAPQHAWLNQIVAVAQGGRRAEGVEYDVFEIL